MMSGDLIPEEAIEAAAKALETGEVDADDPRAWFRGHAENAVRAAAPLILAANQPQTLQNAIDLVSNLGMTAMHAARDAVNAAYHSVPEGAVDLAAVSVLEVVRRALIDVRRGADGRASVLRGEGDRK